MYHFHADHCSGVTPSYVSPWPHLPRPCLLLLWNVPSHAPVLSLGSHTYPPITINKYLQFLYTLRDAQSDIVSVFMSHISV